MSFDSLSFINYKEPQQSMFCIVVFLKENFNIKSCKNKSNDK